MMSLLLVALYFMRSRVDLKTIYSTNQYFRDIGNSSREKLIARYSFFFITFIFLHLHFISFRTYIHITGIRSYGRNFERFLTVQWTFYLIYRFLTYTFIDTYIFIIPIKSSSRKLQIILSFFTRSTYRFFKIAFPFQRF